MSLLTQKLSRTLLVGALSLAITSLAQATPSSRGPFVVYTGTVSTTTFVPSSTKPSQTGSQTAFVIMDQSDNSYFLLGTFDSSQLKWRAAVRGTTQSTDELNQLAGTNNSGVVAANKVAGISLLQYTHLVTSQTTDQVDDTGGFSHHTDVFVTGPNTYTQTTLVAARKATTITPKGYGVNFTPGKTFSATGAIIIPAGQGFPKKLTGQAFFFGLDNASNATAVTTKATVTLSFNSSLTTLANIGGGYTAGKNTVVVNPIDNTIATAALEATAMESFLSDISHAYGAGSQFDTVQPEP